MRIGVACRGGRLRLVLIKADRARRIARGLIRYVDGDALPVIGEACLIDHHCARRLRGPGACPGLAIKLARRRQRGMIRRLLQFRVQARQPGIVERKPARSDQAEKRKRDSGRNSRSEEHTSELQSLMRISYAVFCLKKKKKTNKITRT